MASQTASRKTPGKKTTAARENGRSQAEAARDETAEQRESKQIEFQGLTLELPDELPNTFMWDIAAAQGNPGAFFNLAQSLVPPDQLPAIRGALMESGKDGFEFTLELLDAILTEYGMSVGESAASQDS